MRRSSVTAAFAVISCILAAATVEAVNPSLSGSVSVHFTFIPDVPEIPGDQSYWSWSGVSGSLSLAIPSVIETSIKPSVIGPTPLNWYNPANWTQPTLDMGGVFIGQSGNGTHTATTNYGSSTLDVFRGFGPVEGAATYTQVDITHAAGAGEPAHYPDFDSVLSNHATTKFNVTIPSGAQVHANQYQIIVENLTIQSGGALLEPVAVVRHNLINHGSGTFGGTVQGDFVNDAISASSNVATVSSMRLEGQLQNTGELQIPGTMETVATTANSGTLVIDSGNLIVDAAFTNNGSITALGNNARVSGMGTFVNNGPFQWTAGQINDIGNFTNYSGAFTLSGAASKLSFVSFTNAGTIAQSGGELELGGGKIFTNQAGAVYDLIDDSGLGIAFSGGSVNNSGTFRKSAGTGTSLIGVPLVNSGTIAVNSGILSFADALTLNSAGTIAFQIRGNTAGSDYGKFKKTSSLTLGGSLEVTLGSGFMPALGNSFQLIEWGGPSGSGLIGTFEALRLPPLASGLKWDASLLYTTGVLAVGVGIPGDFNQNGVVDAADYVTWREHLGSIYTQVDYDVWRSHFGETAGSGSGASASDAVPEPATLVMLIVGLLKMCSHRRAIVSYTRPREEHSQHPTV